MTNGHLSDDDICRAIAGQCTLDEHRHITGCSECRVELERASCLLNAFRRDVVARSDASVPSCATALHRARGEQWKSIWALAVTVLALSASTLVWRVRSDEPVAAGPKGPALRGEMATAEEFFPLAYASVPATNARIVRIAVPRSAPAAFGLDPVGLVSVRHDAVLADVVVGEDGLARAVRFIRSRAVAFKE